MRVFLARRHQQQQQRQQQQTLHHQQQQHETEFHSDEEQSESLFATDVDYEKEESVGIGAISVAATVDSSSVEPEDLSLNESDIVGESPALARLGEQDNRKRIQTDLPEQPRRGDNVKDHQQDRASVRSVRHRKLPASPDCKPPARPSHSLTNRQEHPNNERKPAAKTLPTASLSSSASSSPLNDRSNKRRLFAQATGVAALPKRLRRNESHNDQKRKDNGKNVDNSSKTMTAGWFHQDEEESRRGRNRAAVNTFVSSTFTSTSSSPSPSSSVEENCPPPILELNNENSNLTAVDGSDCDDDPVECNDTNTNTTRSNVASGSADPPLTPGRTIALGSTKQDAHLRGLSKEPADRKMAPASLSLSSSSKMSSGATIRHQRNDADKNDSDINNDNTDPAVHVVDICPGNDCDRDSPFAQALKERGLEIRTQEGDGNCLFRAISLQVYGDANNHAEVRKRCMDFMVRKTIGSFLTVVRTAFANGSFIAPRSLLLSDVLRSVSVFPCCSPFTIKGQGPRTLWALCRKRTVRGLHRTETPRRCAW